MTTMQDCSLFVLLLPGDMMSERIIHWCQVIIYLVVIGSMLMTGDAPMRVQMYYYGMRGMGKITRLSRKMETACMERYFDEVNQ